MRLALRVVLGVVATVLVAWAALAVYAAYDRHRQEVRSAQLRHAAGAWRAWATCVAGEESFQDPCRRRLGGCTVGESAADEIAREAEDRARIREHVALELAHRAGREPSALRLDACAGLEGPTDEDRAVAPELTDAWDTARARIEAWRASGAPDLVREHRALADVLVVADAIATWEPSTPPARYVPPEDRWPGYVPVPSADRRRADDALWVAVRHPARGLLRCRVEWELSCQAPPLFDRGVASWPRGAPAPPPALGGSEGEAGIDVVCPFASGAWAMTHPTPAGTDVAIGRDDGWAVHHLGAEDRVQGCVRDALVAFRTARAEGALTVTRTRCTTERCTTDAARLDAPPDGEELRVVDLGTGVAVLSQREGGPLRVRVGSMATLAEVEPVVASLEPDRALGEVLAREGRAFVLDAHASSLRVIDAESPAASACDRDED